MTLAELERLLDSKRRQLLQEQRQRAAFDYKLADLIGISVSRIYSKGAALPSIETAYPGLFSEEEAAERKEQQRIELSALRFKLFAAAYNKRHNKEVVTDGAGTEGSD